jgi:hypothetical protein
MGAEPDALTVIKKEASHRLRSPELCAGAGRPGIEDPFRGRFALIVPRASEGADSPIIFSTWRECCIKPEM